MDYRKCIKILFFDFQNSLKLDESLTPNTSTAETGIFKPLFKVTLDDFDTIFTIKNNFLFKWNFVIHKLSSPNATLEYSTKNVFFLHYKTYERPISNKQPNSTDELELNYSVFFESLYETHKIDINAHVYDIDAFFPTSLGIVAINRNNMSKFQDI